ncbi:MAG: type III restriction endonuclease subunit R, partial [Parcubacteria group bacterium CG22_combo_CG10-13_8_21_14_all_41_9]
GVTKRTVVSILSRVSNLQLMFKNPEEYARIVGLVIRNTLHEIIINDGLKYIPTGDVWSMELFEDIESYANKSLDMRKSEKSLYDRVLWDSEGEKAFAESLEDSRRILLYTKLPRSFVIDTPLGTYNPDWAIVAKTDEGSKVYLVRETKFDIDNPEEDSRPGEQMNILCGQKHFEAIGTNFAVATKRDLSDLNK